MENILNYSSLYIGNIVFTWNGKCDKPKSPRKFL